MAIKYDYHDPSLRAASRAVVARDEINRDTDWKGDRKIGASNRTTRLGGSGYSAIMVKKRRVSDQSRAAILDYAMRDEKSIRYA